MMVPSDMTGRTALVTGAAAGLGQATAIRLAKSEASDLGQDMMLKGVPSQLNLNDKPV